MIVERIRDHVTYARMMGVREIPKRTRKSPVGSTPRGASVVSGEPPVAAVGSPLAAALPPRSSADAQTALDQLRVGTIGDCQRCKLAPTRTQIVFGVGNPGADLLFVGEAPGADEDAQGIPFVGQAGQLLTKIIEAMGLSRDDVYIANIIKCRPPGNRNPHPDEIASCEPFLVSQLNIIRPKLICCLGTFAAQTLLKTKDPISRLRGRWHAYHGIKLMPTFHPAYLLRNPADKKIVWQDMRLIMAELGLQGPQGPAART